MHTAKVPAVDRVVSCSYPWLLMAVFILLLADPSISGECSSLRASPLQTFPRSPLWPLVFPLRVWLLWDPGLGQGCVQIHHWTVQHMASALHQDPQPSML